MKTFHELNEAFPSLFDDKGERKPFNQFLNDVQSIDKQYNSNYLRSEYNFANASASMAARWESFTDDEDYLLEYRTAGDDKVRPEHEEMEGIKRPMRDSFWDTYFPPNGWNCRCTVVEVLRATNEPTDKNEAFRRASEALKGDKKGMFNFNPGKEQKTFPDYNPYTISHCKNCDLAKERLSLAYIPDYYLCRGCKEIHQCYLNRAQENSKTLPKTSVEQKQAIYEMPIIKQLEKVAPRVYRHILKSPQEMDYNRILDAAKLYAKDEAEIIIMAEIHKSEIGVRNRFGLPNSSSNPDLRVNGIWIDVKSPISSKNIVRNAIEASKQGAIACITDHLMHIDVKRLDNLATKVFSDSNYNQTYLHFVVNNTLYKYNSQGKILD